MLVDDTKDKCQKFVEPFYQCCCDCIYLKAVHHHCTTEPQPTQAQKEKFGLKGSCVCGVQKGWACCAPESDRIYDNWPQHSCGCELYTPKQMD